MILKTFLDSAPWLTNSNVLEMPWQQQRLDAARKRTCHPGQADGRLVFAIMRDDGHMSPDPAIQRAIAVVEQSLRSCGYEASPMLSYTNHAQSFLIGEQVIEWTPPSHKDATEVLVCHRRKSPCEPVLTESNSSSGSLAPHQAN